jgi:hypothetical protein
VIEHSPEPWLHTEQAREEIITGWRAFAPLNTWLAKNVGLSTLPPDPAPTRR